MIQGTEKVYVLWIHWHNGWKPEMQTAPQKARYAPTKDLRAYFEHGLLRGKHPVNDCGWKWSDMKILPLGKKPKPSKGDTVKP